MTVAVPLLGPDVTLSMGIYVHQEETMSAESLDRADTALYEAKAAGRDCVVAFS